MSIDKSGKWWIGSKAADIAEYLREYTADDYPVEDVRLTKCMCGSEVFHISVDRDEGAARRRCVKCQTENFICDAEEYWAEAEPESYTCVECKSQSANIGAGFALYEDGEVRWLYLGVRCAVCGVLGCIADWRVGYAPSRHLLEQV